MTDANYTHILAIVDRSGSMTSMAKDMVGGLNEVFKSQAKLDGTCLVDYVIFDQTVETAFQDVPVAAAEAFLQPRGGTALLDAIGISVTNLGNKLKALPEARRPGIVQVIVVTDGYENSSREWTPEAVKDLISQQEENYKWDFTFLGANIDAVSVGAQYGFKADKSLTFNAANPAMATATMDSYVTANRSGLVAGYSDEDRQKNS